MTEVCWLLRTRGPKYHINIRILQTFLCLGISLALDRRTRVGALTMVGVWRSWRQPTESEADRLPVPTEEGVHCWGEGLVVTLAHLDSRASETVTGFRCDGPWVIHAPNVQVEVPRTL